MSVAAHSPLSRRRLLRLTKIASVVSLVAAAAFVVPPWLQVLVPRWFVRSATLAFLGTVAGSFLATLAVAPVVMAASAWLIRRARRQRRPWRRAALALMLSGSLLLGAVILETGSAAFLAWTLRLPNLPTTFRAPASRTSVGGSRATLRVAVVGESSGMGIPYYPWLSTGQVVAWQLQRVFPERRVSVDMLAEPGLNLDQAVGKLARLKMRPDAILLYSGHNEFQSRYGWARGEGYRLKDRKTRRGDRLRALGESLLNASCRYSSLCTLVRDAAERQRLDVPPPPKVTRELVDYPVYLPAEYEFLKFDFRRRLEAFVNYCGRIGALPILIIPAGNDGDFPPSRSMIPADSTAAERSAFARDFLAARALESSDPARAVGAYRALLERVPGFAESHYRLARLLDRAGDWQDARRHFTRARDLDGMPMRCPSDFQQAFREVAARHDVVLVDGPALLPRLCPHGQIDDHQLHDAQHLNFRGYVALAQSALDQFHARRAFGWPEGRPAPVIDRAECAAHFGMNPERWATVCAKSADFFGMIAFIRYDPTENQRKGRRYMEAAGKVASGVPLDEVGLVGLGP